MPARSTSLGDLQREQRLAAQVGFDLAWLEDCAASASQNDQLGGLQMANPYLVETSQRNAAVDPRQIATLIGNLHRTVEILTADIAHAEARRDLSAAASPVLTTCLRSRRENIKRTIASLEAVIQETPRFD